MLHWKFQEWLDWGVSGWVQVWRGSQAYLKGGNPFLAKMLRGTKTFRINITLCKKIQTIISIISWYGKLFSCYVHLIIESREVFKTAIQSSLLVPSTCFVEIKDNSRHTKIYLSFLVNKNVQKKMLRDILLISGLN